MAVGLCVVVMVEIVETACGLFFKANLVSQSSGGSHACPGQTVPQQVTSSHVWGAGRGLCSQTNCPHRPLALELVTA